MKRFICVFLLFVLSYIDVFAQHNPIDSLSNAYATTHDPHILLILAHAYSFRDIPKATATYDSVVQIAEHSKDTFLLADAYILNSLYTLYGITNRLKARDYLNKANILLMNNNSKEAIADKYFIQAILTWQNGVSKFFVEGKQRFDTSILIDFYKSVELQTDTLMLATTWQQIEMCYENPLLQQYPVKSVPQADYFKESVRYYKLAGDEDGALYMLFSQALIYKYDCDRYLLGNRLPLYKHECSLYDSLFTAAYNLAVSSGNSLVQARILNMRAYNRYMEPISLYYHKSAHNFDTALALVKQAEALARKMKDDNQRLRYLYTYMDISLFKNDYKTAYFDLQKIKDFRDSLDMANNFDQITYVQNLYENQTRDIKINDLNTENKIRRSQLHQTTNIAIVSVSSLIAILVLLLAVMNQRKKATAQLEKSAKLDKALTYNLEQQLNDVQQQALRTQMNPHFIYNSLNSIQNLILQEDKTKAMSYLQAFAHLSRLTLEQSRKDFIPLKEELLFLERYLELEHLRHPDLFSYTITMTDDVDPSFESLPPMVIQPVVENAIKHGLLPRKEKGNILIDFSILYEGDAEILVCKIEDDGIGIDASMQNKKGDHKSLATDITALRLEMIAGKVETNAHYSISSVDKKTYNSTGTIVTINFGIRKNS